MNLNDKLENGKDRIMGKAKEAAGKITNNQELEYHGKLQSMKADVGDKVADTKEGVLGKANDLIDKVRGDIKDKRTDTRNNEH